MMDISSPIRTYLHAITQEMLTPTMLILAVLTVYSLIIIGAVICEWLTERRYSKVSIPALVRNLHDAAPGEVSGIIDDSALLRTQKGALSTVADNMGLAESELYALAKTEIKRVYDHYMRRAARTNLLAKISPMLGLMGTLIPLGPGIVAMGKGDISSLSTSLTIAFDTTVVGLIASIVCLIVTYLRRRWYKEYMSALEAAMSCILEKARLMEGADTTAAVGPMMIPAAPASAPAVAVPAATATALESAFENRVQAIGVPPVDAAAIQGGDGGR